VNIVFSSDDNYAPLVGVCLYSLMLNNRCDGIINVYILNSDISKYNKDSINNVVKDESNILIHFIDTEAIHQKLSKLINLNVRSLATWYRVFLPIIMPTSVSKVIYLDCDSYINDTLSELWEIDINEYHVAGVLDTIALENKKAIGLDEKDPYFNAGMLLINLDKWRLDRILDKMIEFIEAKNGIVTYHDQGTINAVCKKKKIIHPKFNAMTPFFLLSSNQLKKFHKLNDYYSSVEIEEAKKSPVFCHLTPYFVDRPWAKGNYHSLKHEYNSFLKRTVWATTINRTPTSYLERWKKELFYFLPFQLFVFTLNLRSVLSQNSLVRMLFRK
jgi:lipopolysaccharide biosynthesis glycosyltransferase